jgi:hypothetical protein
VKTGMVPDLDLVKAWPVLWPLLDRAARRAKPYPVEMNDVLTTVLSGHAQLWAVLDDIGRPIAAVTTQITLEGGKRCRIWLVGGSRMDEWAADFMAKIEPWARSLGCVSIWGTQSRRGWARIVRLFSGEPAVIEGKNAWERKI